MLPGCREEDFLLLDNRENALGKKKPSQKLSISIIGGGLAGLNCAYELSKKGFYADIFEGSSRLGGRVLTKQNYVAPGTYTECGGEYIDTGHKTMRALAGEFGLGLIDTTDSSEAGLQNDTFYIDGVHYTEDQVIAAFQPYAALIASHVQSLPTNFDFTNYTAAVEQFDSMSIREYFDFIGMPDSLFLRKGLEQAYNTEYGREVNEQTAINFLFLFTINPGNANYDIFGLSDERFKVLGGNQQIVDALANSLSAQIHFNHKLTKVGKTESGQYTLEFENGTAVTSDICVLAIPFTLLRQVDLSALELPDWKTNAIDNLGYGTNAKLLLGFTQRHWRNYGHSGGVFTNGNGIDYTFIQTGWDGTRMQPGTNGGYTVFQGGIQGENLNLSNAQDLLDQLDAMWPNTASYYNGITEVMHWPSNPWSLGSYACWRVGQVTTIMGAEGKNVGNLFFAGEHCSLWFQGYMEGAAETGASVAREISKIA
jgi:monoamine oxidase